jgi:hypothetical protein
MTKQCAYCEDNLTTANTIDFLDENLCDTCAEDEALSAEQRRLGIWEDYVNDQITGN